MNGLGLFSRKARGIDTIKSTHQTVINLEGIQRLCTNEDRNRMLESALVSYSAGHHRGAVRVSMTWEAYHLIRKAADRARVPTDEDDLLEAVLAEYACEEVASNLARNAAPPAEITIDFSKQGPATKLPDELLARTLATFG